MTTGVWPDSMVAGVGSSGRKMPICFNLWKNSTPGAMSSARIALGKGHHHHAGERGASLRGVTVECDLAAVFRLQQVVDRRDIGYLRRVVADRHVAAVVVDPGAIGIFVPVRDVV